jgi:hypothetical protein
MEYKKESRMFSAETSTQRLLGRAVLRQLANAALALAVCLVLTAGTAWAAAFTATLEGSFPVQITQGQTVNDTFAVRLATSGAFKNHSGNVIVCNSVTLHADGTFTCNSTTSINIPQSSGAPPQIPGFPQDVQVSVTADANVPCNQTYNISVGVQLDVTGGADFGDGIRQVALPFDVQVACTGSDPQGCSHGYWKNHTDAWQVLSPNTTVGNIFAGANAYGLGNATLLQALSFNGGSTLAEAAQILLRQAVAAVVNADHLAVEYPRTFDEIVFDVNAALDSGNRSSILSLAAALDGDNNLGCPLE